METNLNLEKTTALNKNPKILLVDDDSVFAGMLKRNLEGVGYRVEHCDNGEKAWQQFQKKNYDMCLVDIVMPKMNGFQLAQEIRKKNTLVPIFFLSGEKTMDGDRIGGFKVGADGYLVKPLSLPELQRRIRVFLKWTRPLKSELLIGHEVGDFIFHYRKLKITNRYTNEIIKTISPLEARIIRYFLSRPDLIIKKDELLMKLWGKDDFHTSRCMDVYMGRVRRLLGVVPSLSLETIFNVGMRLNAPQGMRIEKVAIPLTNCIK
ncbi:MAG TPA: response regulator transcription factor [Chitinophaga sp.]|uniref:response regulator transcription factor n=1 Tax=Chitinophaga sp. TaxID=1869181 RepID=UPI002CFD086A|nr:response regulator transcription factor [Chitinophaga sp.]HVI49490.1 response regulator transcription factor [Chitinophaga sp.]